MVKVFAYDGPEWPAKIFKVIALVAALRAIALEPKAPKVYLQAAAVHGHWNKPERSKEILLRCIEH